MKHIKLKHLWRYIGPSPGTGQTHKVIAIDGGTIITTSLTHSWLGTADDFLQQFRWLGDGEDA